MSVTLPVSLVFGPVTIECVSTGDLTESVGLSGGRASRTWKIDAGPGVFVPSTICLFLRVRTLRAVGMGGGRTGATGRGGRSVRDTTGGGGLDVGGCPSASKNLRIRSASDSVGACGTGGGIPRVDVDVRFVWSLPALLAALVSNWNRNATARSKRKTRFSKWAAII